MTVEEYIRAELGATGLAGDVRDTIAQVAGEVLRKGDWRVVKLGHEIPWAGQAFHHVTEELT